MTLPSLEWLRADNTEACTGPQFDAVVFVGPEPTIPEQPSVDTAILRAARIDARVGRQLALVPAPELAGGRLVIAPTGSLDCDGDDVRRYAEAAHDGIRRAREAGAANPLLLLPRRSDHPSFAQAPDVAALGALSSWWRPLEARDWQASQSPGAHGAKAANGTLGLWTNWRESPADSAQVALALESARCLARDVAGTEPERMAPLRVAEYAAAAFQGTSVRASCMSDIGQLHAEYPLLMAVARASLSVPRHRPCVLRLEYRPAGAVTDTLFLAGKGVTYDTGGADLKVGGTMAGMSRDKGGAGAVIGFFQALDRLQPSHLRVVAEVGLVRNSVGADSFVTDEIVVSHAGKRVRIGNTDAEGRLVLADLLSHLRIEALIAPNPRILSVATLTGHAALAVGPYSVAIDNGPALRDEVARSIAHLGERWGEPFEVSRLRREDFDRIRPKSPAEDVISCNNRPSSQTPRGHQFPMAFLIEASGLAEHGRHAPRGLPYTHIDIAGSACEGSDWQHGRPTGAPVVALAARFILNALS